MPSATSRLASAISPRQACTAPSTVCSTKPVVARSFSSARIPRTNVALAAPRVDRRQLRQDARVPPRHRERLVRRGDRLVVAAERGEHPHHRPPSGEPVVVQLHRRLRRVERLVEPPDVRERERLDRRRPPVQRIELPRSLEVAHATRRIRIRRRRRAGREDDRALHHRLHVIRIARDQPVGERDRSLDVLVVRRGDVRERAQRPARSRDRARARDRALGARGRIVASAGPMP